MWPSTVFFQRLRQNPTRDNLVGVLFVMIVDSTIPSAIFANIGQHSFFAKEHEILFSMNTVFRIDEVLELDAVGRLYEAHLTMTGEDDPELRPLTDQINKDFRDLHCWHRLGQALLQAGQLNKAEELYLVALKQKTTSEQDQALYYHNLGLIKDR